MNTTHLKVSIVFQTLDEWDMNSKLSEFMDNLEESHFDNNEMYLSILPGVRFLYWLIKDEFNSDMLNTNTNRPEVKKRCKSAYRYTLKWNCAIENLCIQ